MDFTEPQFDLGSTQINDHPATPELRETQFHSECIDRFAASMKASMENHRLQGKTGWADPAQCSIERLEELLRGAYLKGDIMNIATYCMMLHQRGVTGDHRVPAFYQQTK